MKDCFHMININYILNFNTLSNGVSSFKLEEIEIKPELIKTAIKFSITQINNDEKNIDNIKKNIIEENNSNIIILFERTVELKYGSTNDILTILPEISTTTSMTSNNFPKNNLFTTSTSHNSDLPTISTNNNLFTTILPKTSTLPTISITSDTLPKTSTTTSTILNI